ncbi:MAG: hypothetical protein GX456_03050 [Verrucomicrobia bacterium]|nr:hypothetical protein [Verrucomicrobiota bacterium]
MRKFAMVLQNVQDSGAETQMITASNKFGSIVGLRGRASWFFRVSALAVLITVFLHALPVCMAGDLHMQVQLVWGTDGAPPSGSKYKPLEPQFKNKLARVFKWKNYFLIHEQKVVIAGQDDEKRLKLSSKCEIELKRIDDSTLQIKLFGEGRWTKTVRQSVQALEKGELAVLAGDDKDNYADAWFVVISVPKH